MTTLTAILLIVAAALYGFTLGHLLGLHRAKQAYFEGYLDGVHEGRGRAMRDALARVLPLAGRFNSPAAFPAASTTNARPGSIPVGGAAHAGAPSLPSVGA